MKPLVTIVIPCYNDGLYIEEAIQSALQQTYEPKELILIDDGSDSETKNIIAGLRTKYDFKLIEQENHGLSAARNVGFKNADGTYVLTLDADDRFEPSFLEKAVSTLNNNKHVGFVSCFVNRFKAYPSVKKGHQPKGGGIADFAFRNQAVACSLYRKECWEAVGGYDENMKNGYEDWEFHVSITKHNWECYVIPEYLFNYRDKPNSMLKITNVHHQESILQYVLKKHNTLYKERFPDTIDFLIDKAIFNKTQSVKAFQSVDYRVGNAVLQPLRWLKKIIK